MEILYDVKFRNNKTNDNFTYTPLICNSKEQAIELWRKYIGDKPNYEIVEVKEIKIGC